MVLQQSETLLPNPMAVLREDFDDWAILFDADTGKGYSLNPTAVFIWKCLEERLNQTAIVAEIKKYHTEVPDSVSDDVSTMLQRFCENGLAGEVFHVS